MLGCALVGSLIAGCFGIVHDEVTFTISEEYFTRLKFEQFHYADFGFPPRVFVAEIGFLASWWVGFAAAWFLSRGAFPRFPKTSAFRIVIRGMGIVAAFAALGSIVGYILGKMHGPDFSAWSGFTFSYHITDLPSFVRAAYIHNASYAGGFIGLAAALLTQRRKIADD